MEETAKDRLLLFLKELGIGQTKFEALVGLSKGYISKLKNSPTTEKAKLISLKFPELNPVWLLTGEGEMLKGDSARLVGEVYAAQAGDAAVSGVPFVPVAAHASFIESLEQPSAGLDPDLYPVVLTPAEKAELGKYRVFEVEGESMHPSLRNGSLILAKEVPEASWHYAEGVVVVVTPEMVVVKRVLRNDLLASNSLLLGSDNELYGSYPVPLSDIRAIFKARRIISSDL